MPIEFPSTKNSTRVIVPSSPALASMEIISPARNDDPLVGTEIETVGAAFGAVTVIATADDVPVAPRLSVALTVNEWEPAGIVVENSKGADVSVPTRFPSR